MNAIAKGRFILIQQTTGSAAFVKYGNKTDRPPEAAYAVLCAVYVPSGFHELSIRKEVYPMRQFQGIEKSETTPWSRLSMRSYIPGSKNS